MPKRSEGLQAMAETVLVETGAVRRRALDSAEYVNLWNYSAVEEAYHRATCMHKAGKIDGTLEEVTEAIQAVIKNALE